MGIGPELAGGVLGAGLGAALSPNSSAPDLMGQYNTILNQALQKAINSSTQYTQQAKDQLKQSLGVAEGNINQGNQQAQQGLFNTTRSAFNLGQGLLSPYRNAGYSAQDALMQSLGLATPVGGSQAQADAAAYQQQLGLLQQQYGNGQAPTSPQALDPFKATGQAVLTDAQLRAGATVATPGGTAFHHAAYDRGVATRQQALQEQQAVYAKQQAQYQQKLDAYNQYQAALGQLGPAPQDPSQINQGGQGGQGQGGGANASQSGLQGLLNSTGYQALFGQQPGQNLAQGGTYNPIDAFKQDPGTQYAIEQALKAVNQQGAAKGLLESGSLQQELLKTAQGIQNQKYGEYQDRLGTLFGNYQNQLAGLTQLGSGLTGANTAAQLFSNMGNQQAQYNYGTGTQLAQANLGIGNDIASLLANQGVLNANAYLNTGAAQASGLMQNAGLNAQINSQAMASNAQTNSANNMNNAYMQAAGMFGYNANNMSGNQTQVPGSVNTYSGNPWGFSQAFQANGGKF